jgi:hypothetical protein
MNNLVCILTKTKNKSLLWNGFKSAKLAYYARCTNYLFFVKNSTVHKRQTNVSAKKEGTNACANI